jgi:heptosyltransferase-3
MKGSKPSLAAKRVAIASLSHLGDCIQTLPLAAVLKEHWPSVEVVFVASEAMKPLFDCCASADGFLSSEEVLADFQSLTKLQADVFLNPYPHLELAEAARKARIPVRVGNLRRTKHIRFCNRFVFYGRGYSGLYEAQLHLKDLSALGIRSHPVRSLMASQMRLTKVKPLPENVTGLLDPLRFNLILHTKSSGNGRDWPLSSFFRWRSRCRALNSRSFSPAHRARGKMCSRNAPNYYHWIM